MTEARAVPEYLPVLTRLADRQRGYFTHTQALRAGVTSEALAALKAARVIEDDSHRKGVYGFCAGAPGDPLHYYTAWLLLDEEVPAWEREPPQCCVAWKATALEWWGVTANTYNITAQFVHPTREAWIGELHNGATVVNAGRLDERDWVIRDGLPVTLPARTLADMAQFANPEELGYYAYWLIREEAASVRELESGLTELFGRGRDHFYDYANWTGGEALSCWAECNKIPIEGIANPGSVTR